MSQVFKNVVSYFKKEHGEYCTIDEKNKVIFMRIKGDNDTYQISCNVSDSDIFKLGISDIIKIPKQKTAYACILTNLVNQQTMTTFFIDSEDDLMAVLVFPVIDCVLSETAIDMAFMLAISNVDKYYPAYQKLIWSDTTPEEAFDAVQDKKEE